MADIQKNQGASATGTNNSSSPKNNEPGSQESVSSSAVTNAPLHPYQSEPLPPKLKSVLPAASQCTYTPCYCEENVWKMCDRIRTEYPAEIDYCHVAFISNPKRMVPMWRQKSGKNEEKLALWDYHVILFYNPDDRCVVYDMDSDLPFPTHFHKRHMVREDGSWIKPPPSYPPICPNGGSNMEQFLDMTTPKNEFGELFNLMELVRRFYKPRQLS
ncbi:unnamed protein product [Allacma fusca]|uniref:Protein N-terminal glutamine amidohydrolase n=1 Tax=Allacma fusca TaxID=39272 RepID=A0A8J2LDK6_9HEXA|nr:unnamed protein product [Allacma fusca]